MTNNFRFGLDKETFFQSLNAKEKSDIEVFIKEFGRKPLPDWLDPSNDDLQNIKSAAYSISLFDDDPVKAATMFKLAFEEAGKVYEAVGKAAYERARYEAGLRDGNITWYDYFGDDREQFLKAVMEPIYAECDEASRKRFESIIPTYDPEMGIMKLLQ